MPRESGVERAPTFSDGLYDRATPLLITEKHCSEAQNVNFDNLSVEEASGLRKLNSAIPPAGGVRFKPIARRSSIIQMTRWRDGHLMAPLTKRLEAEPRCIEAHCRIEETVVWPESGPAQVARVYGGLTGRYTGTVGTQRNGGEHQFFPLVSRGAREVERPHFVLGVGIIRPQGLKDAAVADDSSPDAIYPIFAWWDSTEQRLRVAAANKTLHPGLDYHLAVDFGAGASSFYVNGVAVGAIAGYGLSALPLSGAALFTTPSLLPVYFGRCYTREPGIRYDDPGGTVQHNKKHAYMGKLGCVVSNVAGAVLTLANQQLAFTGAVNGSSYLGYRVRVQSGAGGGVTGRVFIVTNSNNTTNDATITLTINAAAHGIAINDIVDVIPAIEPISAEVTMQEVRFFYGSQGATAIAKLAKIKLFSDPRQQTFDKAPGLASDFGATPLSNLIAYWPLDDDGGAICRDLVERSDAYFGPSAMAIQDRGGASASSRTLVLDGETQAVRIDLSRDPNFKLNAIYNLGKTSSKENHWNVCVRMQFFIGGSMEFANAGSLQNHLFQSIFSLGNPASGTPILEARLTNFGANGLHIYFRLPDGTYQAVPYTLTPGRYYNAILGLEGVGEDVAAPELHYAYFQFLDADLSPGGAFSAAITMKRVVVDPAQDYVLTFGASTRGVAEQGVGSNNHALIGMACLGVGYHPAHRLGAGAPAGTLSEIVPLIRFSDVKERADCIVPITGQDGGGTLVNGSRAVVVASQEALPSYLRRFPVEAEHVTLTIVEKGEADKYVANAQVVKSVSGSTVTMMSSYQGYNVAGAELKAQVWAAYTSFETFEPAFDTDLNAGRETGEQWALTKGPFSNIVGGVLRFDMVIDPGYEFVSPLRVAPEWGPGIVVRCDSKIRALKQFKNSTRAGLMAVVAGSLFEVDDRWRRDNPWRKDGFSFEFRVKPDSASRSLVSRRESAAMLVTESRPYRGEALSVTSGQMQGIFDGDDTIEADVKFFSLDGRQTIAGSGEQTIGLAGGVGRPRWCWVKNHHFYVNNGDLVFEIVDELNAVYVQAKTTGNPAIRVNEWVRLQVAVTYAGGVLTGVTFRVNGRTTPSTLIQSGGFGQANIPFTTGETTIGAIGASAVTPFMDVLNGRIAGYAMRNQDNSTWPYFGADYPPAEITDDDYLGFGQGYGSHIVSTSGVEAFFLGDECIPTGHGMGAPTNDPPTSQEVSMLVFGDALYVNTGFTRPWRWDFEEFTPAGLREPAGRLRSVTVTRTPLRTKDAGADLPSSVGRLNRADLNAASPHLRTFVPANPNPAEGDKGGLVYVPADPDMGAGTDYPPGYIGVASDISALPGYVLAPVPFTQHLVAAAGECAWTFFRTKAAVSLGNVAYLAAIQLLKSTTPWGARRLLCDGKDDNSAPETEALAEGPTNESAIHFRGNVYLESSSFRSSTMPLARGKVLSVKGYLKIDAQTTFGDTQVLWEMAVDGESGVRLVLFDGGRLRFEFYDTLLGGFRSIQTVGKVVSVGQWYYLHFRYRFKQKANTILDSTGGWEADLRWLRKAPGGVRLHQRNDFRDQLLIYACEGLHQINPGGYTNSNATAGYYGDVDEAAPCLLLTLPGCESSIGSTIANGAANTNNHSQHLLNAGILRSAPYLTPEPGDGLFPAAGVLATSPRSGIVGTLNSNLIAALIVAGTPRVGSSVGGAALGGYVPQFTLPGGFCLPRSCSMNRSDAWNRKQHAASAIEESSSLYQKAAGVQRNFWNSLHVPANTAVQWTPNLGAWGVAGGSSSYGKQEGWAVLVRVWSMVATGGGPGAVGAVPNGLPAGTPRVLALVHLNETDVGVAAIGGAGGHQIFVTDDPIYGGDGLGDLLVGGAVPAVGSTWHITIELPNGSNQASTSNNRLVCPSLLEYGPNPVGINDSPDPSLAPMRFGGTTKQGEEGVVRSGFKGYMDDWGVLIADLNHSDANIYTTDCLPPDAFFTGPKDTRIQSLPRLAFTNNALIIDDASGAAATLPTVVYRFDELSGGVLVKDGSYSASEATSLFIVKVKRALQVEGEHRFRVTFYDPRQDVESRPGEEYLVRIEGDQSGGDFLDSETLFTLEGIPISGDRRQHLARRIYKTLPESGLPLRLATIKDGTTTGFTPYQDDVALAAQDPLQFDNGRPPRCRAIACNEANMIFAGIDDAPNVLAISKPFKPEHVPGTQIQYGESGRGGGLIAANFIETMIVAAKRNALFIVVPSGSTFRMHRIGQAIGILAHNSVADVDGVLYFLAQKGVFTFAGNQRAYEATELVDRLYQQDLDIRALEHSAGAYLGDRGQYIVLVTRLGDKSPYTLLCGEMRFDEFGNRYYVWTLMEMGVAFSAITEYEDEYANAARVAIGTELGAVARYDAGDGVLRDSNAGIFKMYTGTIVAGSGTRGKLVIVGAGTFDNLKDSMVGLPVYLVYYLNAAGAIVSQSAAENYSIGAIDEVVLARDFTGAGVTLYTRNFTNWSVLQGGTVYIGNRPWVIRSKWFTMDEGESVKRWNKLDLYFDPVSGGVVFVELYVDMQATPNAVFRVELDQGFFSLPIDSQFFRLLQFRIKGFGFTNGFKLHSYALRGDPAEYAQRQKS